MREKGSRRLMAGLRGFVVPLLLLLCACGVGPRPDGEPMDSGGLIVPPSEQAWKTFSSEDRGTICLVAAKNEEEALAAAPADHPHAFTSDSQVFAVYGLCFTPDCHRNVELTIERDGLAFATRARWEEVTSEGSVCTHVCEVHLAASELDPVTEGKHSVTFAGDSLTLQVPGTQRACVGASPFGWNAVGFGEGEPVP